MSLAFPIISAALSFIQAQKGAAKASAKEQLKEAVADNMKAPSTYGGVALLAGSSQVPADSLEAALVQIALGLVGLIMLFVRRA